MGERTHALAKQLFGKNSLQECDLHEVRNLARRFPFFAPAQFLLLQKLKETQDPEYNEQLERSILYYHNPLEFQFFIAPERFYTEFDTVTAQPSAPPEVATAVMEAPLSRPLPLEEVPVEEVPVTREEVKEETAVELPTESFSENTEEAPNEHSEEAREGDQEEADEAPLPTAPEPTEEAIEEPTFSARSEENTGEGLTVTADDLEESGALLSRDTGEVPAPEVVEVQGSALSLVPDTGIEGTIEPGEKEPETPVIPAQEEPSPAFQPDTIEPGEEEAAALQAEETAPFLSGAPEEEEYKTPSETETAEVRDEQTLATKTPVAEAETENTPEEPETSQKEVSTEALPAANSGGFTFEPFHTVDYFASQGIKLSQEETGQGKLSKQLRSFTEWLKTMKRLPATEIAKNVDTTSESRVRNLAQDSIHESDVWTEAMAEVWIKQGNPAKAVEVYNKLSLLNPSKNAYFAAKIEKLKHS